MPEHTSFLSYLVAMFPALGKNMENFGNTFVGHHPVGEHQAEPIAAVVLVVAILLGIAFAVRKQIADYDKSVIPDETLSLRTLVEVVVTYFYTLMRDMMGPERAKRYFPIIGTSALFILVANFLGMIPGFLPPTSSLNVTAACAIIIAVAFNYYGVKENGLGYFKHMMGPVLPLAILIFPLELLTMFVIRPVTLALRLMLNIAVDHLLASIMVAIFALFLPIPILILGTLVAGVQALVFCLLASIYITLATEHEDHGDGHGHAEGHAKAELGAKAHA
ncbi:MAG TPA: F0F1 ATP synthase subunit A [Polyangiaceae bacterium]|jgi:F-type H+-transporting ATPase subunit a|nr:F0F1 ATP synthase subunit A [Polyangiaceae bacterium]